MSRIQHLTSRLTLHGYPPIVVTSDRQAFELSERTFTKLDGFKFHDRERRRLVSSGPRFDGWSALLINSSGHRVALNEEERVGVLVPYRGTIEVEREGKTASAGPMEVLIVDRGCRETRLSKDYLGVLIQVPATGAKRMDAGLATSLEQALLREPLVRVAAAEALSQAHRLVEQVERLEAAPSSLGGWTALVQPLWSALASAICRTGQKSPAALSLRQLRAAEEFIAANAGTELSLGTIAQAVGVGGRSLQAAFRRHRRCTPLEFLTEQRLRLARERLLGVGGRGLVTGIAIDCGFSHLGRFAAKYRQAFGETPLDTVRGARRHDA